MNDKTTKTSTPTPETPAVASTETAEVQMLRASVATMPVQKQMAALNPPMPIQFSMGGGGTAGVHQAAAQGVSGGGGAMPYLDRIQSSFGGHDVSGVQAHTGGTATKANEAMGAKAYASGNNVAFKGQPDLHTAAHEAAHIVQQRQGVSLQGGVGKVGDTYEKKADAVADAVVSGKSAEKMLGPSK
jgi:hypothetical protein